MGLILIYTSVRPNPKPSEVNGKSPTDFHWVWDQDPSERRIRLSLYAVDRKNDRYLLAEDTSAHSW